jgi:hypothetical protein
MMPDIHDYYTKATWKVGDTGLVKKLPAGHLLIGARVAEKLGMTAGMDGWEEFRVVEEGPAR